MIGKKGRARVFVLREDRLFAQKEYNTRCFEKNKYYCVACKKEYHLASKMRHLRTERHQRNVKKEVEVMRGSGKM